MPDLTVQSVDYERLAQVYPLIRAATRVSLERWLEFGWELLQEGGGVIAIRAADNYVHGVAAYRRCRNLRHEQVLDVEVIVAFDLRGDDRIREALYRELEKIAVERGCSSLNFTVAGKSAERSSRTRSGLERLGLRLDTASFVRDLPVGEN